MRKFVFIVAFIALFLTSCKEDEVSGKIDDTFCWSFNIVSTYYAEEEVVNVMTAEQTVCDLTEENAEKQRKSLESTLTNGPLTIVVTATKEKE